MSKCDRCVTDKSECIKCRDNPIYADVPRASKFRAYKPTCPKGYGDCVYDPAYIKCYDPEYYKDVYGEMTPEEASAEFCNKKAAQNAFCYDDEDK